MTNNPYVGPRTFSQAQANLFFGRDREARDLLGTIMTDRVTLFYASSGAGKSSLIHTRIVPGLQNEGFTILPIGRVGGALSPEVEFVDNIFATNLILSLDLGNTPEKTLTRMSLVEYIGSILNEDEPIDDIDDDEQAYYVLIIDQFEELFTTHLDRWIEREEFFRQLDQAITQYDNLWVLLVLREDYVARLDPYQRLMPNRLRSRFYMQRMNARAALDALEQPAMMAGRPFESGVAKVIVDNLRAIRGSYDEASGMGEFIDPIQLQVVGYQLWENLRERPLSTITMEDVYNLGNVDTALAQFYESLIQSVCQQIAIPELMLRRWFETQLITEAGTRGTVYQGSDETAGMSNEVVRLLADSNLLRVESRAGGIWYELTHDRFIQPILQANQAWQAQQSPIIQAALAWEEDGRPSNRLLSARELEKIKAGRTDIANDPLVQSFLVASYQANKIQEEKKAQEFALQEVQRAMTARYQRLVVVLGLLLLLSIVGNVILLLRTYP